MARREASMASASVCSATSCRLLLATSQQLVSAQASVPRDANQRSAQVSVAVDKLVLTLTEHVSAAFGVTRHEAKFGSTLGER